MNADLYTTLQMCDNLIEMAKWDKISEKQLLRLQKETQKEHIKSGYESVYRNI